MHAQARQTLQVLRSLSNIEEKGKLELANQVA
jgi:hypothetical protein